MEKEKQKERKLKRVFLQKKYNLLTTVLVALCVALLSGGGVFWLMRSEEHTSELQSRE